MILKCKNQDVYNIDTEEVLNNALLPGYMRVHGASKNTFLNWFKIRYNSETNTVARLIRGSVFGGQGKRNVINITTKALSLSDSYWLYDENLDVNDNKTLFEDISPYYTKFWKSKSVGKYNGEAIPTLYVGGYLPKEWKSKTTLWKSKSQIEVLCAELCEVCGVPVAKVRKTINGGINVTNITSSNIMLEQADMSGRFTEDFTDDDIYNEFGLNGLKMLVIDAIVGNPDRHLGNFGYMRNANTGEYVGMAPLYDFDMALQSSSSDNDGLIQSIVNSLNRTDTADVKKIKNEDKLEVIKMLNKAQNFLKGKRKSEYVRFRKRCENIINQVVV